MGEHNRDAITITREEARIAMVALYSHHSKALQVAEHALATRSSDKPYEHNAHCSQVARDYKRIAADCEALRLRIVAWLDSTAAWCELAGERRGRPHTKIGE